MDPEVKRSQAAKQPNPSAAMLKLETQQLNGAHWFFWIAGLSLVNSAIIHAGGEWSFIIGLGITQFVDAIASAVAMDAGAGPARAAQAVAIVADLVVAGLFVAFGILARKRHSWAFVVGMLLYGLDGLLFLLVRDWLSIGFHVFALVSLAAGLSAARQLGALDAPRAPAAGYEPITP